MNRSACFLVFSVALALAGCDSPRKTADTLRTQIAEFKTSPTEERQAEIEANFARLDEQIAKLKAGGKLTQANELEAARENLKADFRAARLVKTIDDAKAAVQTIGDAFQEAGKSLERAFKDAKDSDSQTQPDR